MRATCELKYKIQVERATRKPIVINIRVYEPLLMTVEKATSIGLILITPQFKEISFIRGKQDAHKHLFTCGYFARSDDHSENQQQTYGLD